MSASSSAAANICVKVAYQQHVTRSELDHALHAEACAIRERYCQKIQSHPRHMHTGTNLEMNKLLALSAKTIRRLRMTDKMITPVGSLAQTGNRIAGEDDLWLVDTIIRDLRAEHPP